MIGSIVQPSQSVQNSSPASDPLSDVLTMLKPSSYSAGGFAVQGEMAIQFPKHEGIKCYAMLGGRCWLVLEGMAEPVLLTGGDCFLLPRGMPFRLTIDLALEPVYYTVALALSKMKREPLDPAESQHYIVGGHFVLSGSHAAQLLQSLPPIVHIRREEDKAAMRWSIERMRDELRNPQPGGTLIAQQLAYMMLVQALRLHLNDRPDAAPGWLAALADKHMSLAVSRMHQEPGQPWTLRSLAECVGMSRSVFASRFRETVGTTPMEYLARWRMMLAADRLHNTADSLSTIAKSLGYESESAFGKAFRRVMGCSPREHVKKNSTLKRSSKAVAMNG